MCQRPTRQLTITKLALPETTSIQAIFSHFAHLDYAILLDSAGSQQSNSRFDYMYWQPERVVVADNGRITVEDHVNHTSAVTSEPPFQAVNHCVEQLKASLIIENRLTPLLAMLPGAIGAVGHAGYDLGRYYESLPSQAANEVSTPDMVMGIYSQSLIYDNHDKVFYYVSTSDKTPVDFSAFIHTEPKPFSLTSSWQSNLSEQGYHQALDKIHHYLVEGDCYQVNMAQRFSARYHGDEWSAYVKLREQNQAPFSAFIRLPNSAILSISPERFLSVKNGNVETKPIKGTRPRSDDSEQDRHNAEDLLSAEKDRAENLMIVDLLRNDLSKHCEPGSVKVPNLFALESYAAVHHMVSTVVGKLKPNATALDLMAGAFPGGSITGAPKVRAMEIIDELEPHRRNIYCGSVLYFDINGNMDSSICIRTLLAENNTLYCHAGGGIVLDSKANEEYQETLDKVARILPVLE